MTKTRCASLLVLCMVAAAAAGSSSIASPSPSPLLNTDLYWGTLRPDASCTSPKRCTAFVATLRNTSKVTLNSFMIGVDNTPFASFSIAGASCKAVGMQFGANFKNDWLCLGLHVPPGATVLGLGVGKHALTPATTARFDWSDKGNAGGLMPDTSEMVHFAPFITPEARLDLQLTETHTESAMAQEAMLPADTLKEIATDAKHGIVELNKAEVALNAARASGAFQSVADAATILKNLQVAIVDDEKAEHAPTITSAKASMKAASTAKKLVIAPTIAASLRLPLP